ncbi:FAD binding domain-containing protein [Bacillus sp. CGMCC 1.16607]|uniref:FAD binding domain-containing protein n=1 Tax=Bacillus sp. CGMCC 1.16607 TaxID=3351842 RepID=UPI003629F505
MLSINTEYYKPQNIKEATELFFSLKAEDKRPIYYSGGTEILTLERLNLIQAGALIDIKGIPECTTFEIRDNLLILGSALPLTSIEEKNLFPLLTKTSMGIADRTARNKITLGGNICGIIFYREAVLPFLLTNSFVKIADTNGEQQVPIHDVFNQTLQLKEGQFLTQVLTEKVDLQLPFISVKKRQQWETGYPLLTIASMKKENQLRFAFSGLCPFPFRSSQMEAELNKTEVPVEERITKAIEHIPHPILDDLEGSKDYRLFVLRNTLTDIFFEMEGK